MTKSYITFNKIKDTGKTYVFAIIAKSDDMFLGTVKWYAPWRKYVFTSDDDTVWDSNCLFEVAGFILGLMDARRKS